MDSNIPDLPNILKDFKERESDIIYKIKFNGKEVIFYCLIELQSTVDYTMPFRLLIYMTELWWRYLGDADDKIRERAGFRLPAIIPVVFYNGQDEWTTVRSFKEYLNEYESFNSRVVDFEYILLNVNKYKVETLKEIGSLISSVFLLDKNQDDEHLINNIAFATKILSKLTSDERVDFTDWLKDVLFKKAKGNNKDLIYKAIASLEEGDMESMTYAIERIFDEVEEKGVERGMGIGREQGIGIGWEQGREERNVELVFLRIADMSV